MPVEEVSEEDGSVKVVSSASEPASSLLGIAKTLFVPSGTISRDYYRFQLADSIQATCSYLRGILAMHATLTGAGVLSSAAPAAGEAAAVLAAVVTFILKDGAAMAGSLLFAYFSAHLFDAELRFWRLFADVINDVGLTVELLAPLLGPRLFLSATCAANVCKALCGVAAGATRVSLARHFAMGGGNLAEVQAKEGAQETAITLLGLCLGLTLASALNSSPAVQWSAFAALTAIHVVANYYCVRTLELRSINRSRAGLLARSRSVAAAVWGADSGASELSGTAEARRRGDAPPPPPPQLALTPSLMASCEPVLPAQYARAAAAALCCGSDTALRWLCCGRRASRAALERSDGGGLAAWISAWDAEPCRIRLGVPWAVLHATAAAAAGEAPSSAGASAAPFNGIARVELPMNDSEGGGGGGELLLVAVAPRVGASAAAASFCADSPLKAATIAIALPPSATSETALLVYLGVRLWAAEAEAQAAESCAVQLPPRAADSLAMTIAATLRAAPRLRRLLEAAAWDSSAQGVRGGGCMIAEEGARLTLKSASKKRR